MPFWALYSFGNSAKSRSYTARLAGSGLNVASIATRDRTSSRRTWPSARPAKIAAPRRLACSGSATRSIGGQ